MKIELNNRIALVLGGTSPLGTAICRQLGVSGARVITDYHATDIRDWQSQLAAEGIDISAFDVDLTDFDACVALIENIEKSVGPIDIIVNNPASGGEPVPFEQMSRGDWQRSMTGNIDTVFNVCRNLAERMSNRGFGRIINISSVIGRMGQPGHTHEAAAKAGLHGFTMALAQEVARKGITVNTISPGHIAGVGPGEPPATIPAGRAGNAGEIASLVDYLCSDHAAYINGADIAINGGQYMH